MTDYAILKDWPDTISFDRLHALARCGYRVRLGAERDDSGFARIDLWHPKVKGIHIPPKLTVWSNGIVATRDLLWPAKHVPQENGAAPDWQKFIDVSDDTLFQHFIQSIPKPTAMDVYVYPSLTHFAAFLARLVFATTLCVILALCFALIARMIGN